MSKELITLSDLSVAEVTKFKDKRLNEATTRIVRLYSEAAKMVEAKNREFAVILSQVKNDKSYEADGFKSVADYAEKTFGLTRSTAYSVAAAGDIYNDSKANATLKSLPPSKLTELSSVPPDKLDEAVKAGAISVNSTQKELREFAKNAKASDAKPQVLSQYTARLVAGVVPDALADMLSSPKLMNEWEEVLSKYITDVTGSSRAPEIVKLPKCSPYKDPLGDKKVVNRQLYITEQAAYAFEFYTYVPEKPASKPEAPKFTKEQLLAMLAALEGGESNNG